MFTLKGQTVRGAKVFYRQDSEVGVMDNIGENIENETLTSERIWLVTRFITTVLENQAEPQEIPFKAFVIVTKANNKVLMLIDSMIMRSADGEISGWSYTWDTREEFKLIVVDEYKA